MRKLMYFLVGFVLVCAFALGVNSAAAQGGPSCGSLACEGFRASNSECFGNPARICGGCTQTPISHECSQTVYNIAANRYAYFICKRAYEGQPMGTWNGTIGGSSPGCNCTNSPDLPGGSLFTKANGKLCTGGCLFKAKGPSTGYPDGQGHYVVDSPEGWKPDGAQCNPFDNEEPESEPPPDPVACQGEGADEVCIPENQEPPDFCVEVGGERICVGPDDGPCAGDSSSGYLCSGNPPDDPPPPPETRPDPNNPSEPHPPTASGGPNTQCNGAGSCSTNNWEYTPGGGGGGEDPPGDPPEDDDDDPPSGGQPGGVPGLCPDGSVPQQGQCPAPVSCPGGGTPVNGQCPNGGLQCPVGTVLVEGQCSDGSEPTVICPEGTTANPNGTCTGVAGTCPNGSRPVNGMCDIASQCDPLTDPDQCEGQDEGHASGGEQCSSPPACSGDAIMCAVLNQQWRTRCAVEALGGDGTTPTAADYGEGGTQADVWGTGDGQGAIDDGGFLGGSGGGECPDMGVASFAGESFAINDWIPCSALRILAALILAGGFAQAAYIIGRG